MQRRPPDVVNRARELRRQKKLSFEAIGRLLHIHSSTIRNWCHDLPINRHETLRINNELRRIKVKKRDINVVPLPQSISSEQARLFAALLYGCEGCKYPSSSTVSFVNSDPQLSKTFISLLRKGFVLKEAKFRVHLQIHTTHDFENVKEFWSNLLNIPKSQFIKPTITVPRGKMRRQHYMGTCSIRYIDYKIILRLMGIFEKFCKT